MKKILVGGLIFTVILSVLAVAQQPQKKGKTFYKGRTYLAGGVITNGTISKAQFDSLIAYPLLARDTSGKEHPVITYTFVYAERGVFEDSMGKMKIMTDYYSVESDKGQMPDVWVKNVRKRSKSGDTAYFNEVISTYADSVRTRFHSEPLKLIITE
jgi:hypothetical protein